MYLAQIRSILTILETGILGQSSNNYRDQSNVVCLTSNYSGLIFPMYLSFICSKTLLTDFDCDYKELVFFRLYTKTLHPGLGPQIKCWEMKCTVTDTQDDFPQLMYHCIISLGQCQRWNIAFQDSVQLP